MPGSVSLWVFPTLVGMFRAVFDLHKANECFPHARGDVPAIATGALLALAFSPRSWGCSGEGHHPGCRERVFPTLVGMFRTLAFQGRHDARFPHARGDVPDERRSDIVDGGFSPRSWGCSDERRSDIVDGGVFPTLVGMFRFLWLLLSLSLGFPHARGDVPQV